MHRRHFDLGLFLRRLPILQRLIARDAFGALGATRLGTLPNPLRFPAQQRLPLALTRRLHLQPLGLLLQEFGIVRRIAIQLTAEQLYDPPRDAFQEIPIVRDHDEASRIPEQPILQPRDHFVIQMVGRLVQDQHLRRAQQGNRQCRTLFLPAGQFAHRLVKLRESQAVQDAFCLIFLGCPFRRAKRFQHL